MRRRKWNYTAKRRGYRSLRKELSQVKRQLKTLQDRQKLEDTLRRLRSKESFTLRVRPRFGRFL